MVWILFFGVLWVALAVALAVVVGRSVRLADRRASGGLSEPVPDFVPAHWTNASAGSR